MKNKSGMLYGIGVGPGDPDLIPVKAVNILKKIDVIFAAASSRNQHSQAVIIATNHIPANARIINLSFPMTQNEKKKEAAWEENAQIIIDTLNHGQDCAFLTLGDPMTFATYGYILKAIQRRSPETPITTIPGITSYQAAAARVNIPLVEGEESLIVLSGVKGGDHLRQISEKVDNIVILKAYRHVDDITVALKESGMLENSVGIVNCGFENEEIITDINEFKKHPPRYWTLIISKKKKST